jgi:hypothetical protein
VYIRCIGDGVEASLIREMANAELLQWEKEE